MLLKYTGVLSIAIVLLLGNTLTSQADQPIPFPSPIGEPALDDIELPIFIDLPPAEDESADIEGEELEEGDEIGSEPDLTEEPPAADP